MTRRTIVVEVESDAQEAMARQAVALMSELEAIGDGAADGTVLDVCELATLKRRDEFGKALLQAALQRRVAALEKKGRRCASATAVGNAKIAPRISAR